MALEINRIIDANGICTYLDDDVQEAAFVLALYGFDLEALDSFLESLPKSERLKQFLEWRSHALHAIKNHNESAAEGWCSALNASRFEYVKSKSLFALAVKGENQKKDGKKNALIRAKKYDVKRDQLIEIWRTGKYSTKALCAEQEFAALGIAYDTARKYLINV